MTSIAIQKGLDEFELDAGFTYLDNEPLDNVRTKQLYRERYLFVTNINNSHAQRSSITWREAVRERLCLLTEDMQNRRVLNMIVDSMAVAMRPTVVSNSFLGVCSHVSLGSWSSIVPHTFAYIFSGCSDLKLIELVEPAHSQMVGLVTSNRDPLTPLAKAFMASATRFDPEPPKTKRPAMAD
jgi:DNA-binding transcriptional LysR family regulator